MFHVLAVRWCAGCRAEQMFELPPCEDGHGDDCPDLACVECGSAIVLGGVSVDVVVEADTVAPAVARSAA
ncbi:MAG TPA: hypothetical protein VM433_04310 [Mycobacteriales bacterium]|nr:hypothetical protein [Mycobacteriales bacterium]